MIWCDRNNFGDDSWLVVIVIVSDGQNSEEQMVHKLRVSWEKLTWKLSPEFLRSAKVKSK